MRINKHFCHHKQITALVAALSLMALTACGGVDIGEAIEAAGQVTSSPNTGSTTKTLSEKPAEPDRPPTLTEEQEAEGVRTAYACTTRTLSLEQNPDSFVMFNPQAGIVFPGALIQGKSYETAGSMLPIAGKRGPGTVTLDIASGTTGSVFRELDTVEHSTVTEAINEILAEYDALTPAKASFTMKEVQSAEQLAAEAQANVSGATFDIAATLSFSNDSETSKLLVELKQEYFTVAFQTPETPESVFGPGASAARLARQMGTGNPPVYVGSVTYGRIFYLLFESSASAEDMRASLSGAYRAAIEADASAKTDWSQQLSETRVSSYAIGGSASGALSASTALMDGAAGIEAVWNFIVDDANFSPQSPGAPISYKIVNLADNTPIRLSATTTYDVKDCQIVTTGCDGVEGSGKVSDACGVCGGNNACQQGCSTKSETFGNDKVFIYVDLPASEIGRRIDIQNMAVAQYYLPRCYRVWLEEIVYRCDSSAVGGRWSRSGVVGRDAACTSYGDWKQDFVRVRKQE